MTSRRPEWGSRVEFGRVKRKVKSNRTVQSPTVPSQASITSWTEKRDDASGDGGQLVISLPTFVPGDGMFVAAAASNEFGGQADPAGWTLIGGADHGGGTVKYLWRVMESGDPATLDIPTGSRGVAVAGRVAANGADLSAVTPEIQTANGTINPPSISPSGGTGDYLIICGWMVQTPGGTLVASTAVPSGYVVGEEASSGNANNQAVGAAYGLFLGMTSEDPGVFTLNHGSPAWSGAFTVAISAGSDVGEIAAGDHTHVEADVTDLDHWTEADHDALDHTGLTGVGGGSVDDLSDVTITGTPADNELFAYDTGTAEWINQTAAEAGVAAATHTHTESEVTDLDHWDETDHDALDHTGLTGVISDHGGLSGLTDDDHSLYSKADGTRAFTGVVSGVTPTTAAHLATKAYVDGQVQGGRWELVVDPGTSDPPVAVTTEDGTDFVYGLVED